MHELMLQLGVGGILAILVLREVFSFLRSRGNNNIDLTAEIRCVKTRIDELYRWHDVRDEDGTPIWYRRASMTRSIERLTSSISELERAVQRQAEILIQLMEVESE